MKKAIVLALAVILTLSLTVPAAAVTSPAAQETSQTTTAPLPKLVSSEILLEDGSKIVIELFAVTDVASLPEEAQKAYAAAQASLEGATPDGMKVQYFFYATTYKVNADGTTEPYEPPVDVTLQIDNIIKVAVKQYLKDAWGDLDTDMTTDGLVTIKGVVDGPMAIFTA